MMRWARAATVVTLLLGTTGCYWNWNNWPPWQLPSHKTLINSYFVKVQPDCARTEKKVDVVHVTIANIDEADLHSSTLSHYGSDNQGDTQVGTPVPPPPTPISYETHVDFTAAPYLRRPGDVAMIELQLTDRNYTFQAGRNNTVITSDAAHGYMFCVKRDMVVPEGARKVDFYVRWVKTVDGLPVVGAYNFMLRDRRGDRRFLEVDPNVENEG